MHPTTGLPRAVLAFTAFALATLLLGTAAVRPADAQTSRNVTLLSHMDLYDEYFACWSYVHQDGREYAVILSTRGASIVRLTDPTNPVEVGFFNAPGGLLPGVPVRRSYAEAKQYGHYLYLVTDLVRGFDATIDPNDEGMAIIDMSNPDQPHKVASLMSPITNAHTIAIDQDRGLLFANGVVTCNADFTVCELGMKIFSLADPEHPALLATYPQYAHDVHVRGNRAYVSLIFTEDDTKDIAVLDITDPSNPVELAFIDTPRTLQHSTWTSEDGRFLYAANEVERDGLTVWDVSDVANIRKVFTFVDLPEHIVHQPHVVGTTLSLAYYSAGVRLMDIRNPAWPVEFGYYDTYDGRNGYYDGAWECAPYYPSGIFVISDIQSGLWVFRAEPPNYGLVRGTVREAPNGPIVAGATVTAIPAGLTVKTDLEGRFAFALPPGTSTLAVSAYAFESSTTSVGVALDSDQTVSLTLRRLPTGNLSGVVMNGSGVGQASAEVSVLGTPHRATTDASGAYSIAAVPEGSYTVRAARPGLAASAVAVALPRGKTTKQDFALGTVSYYDDAEAERGWTVNDITEFSGRWTRAVPLSKVVCDTGDEIQPGEDHTPSPGTMCFLTSNRTITCCSWCGAVNGLATLTSPPIPLSGISDPRLGYWYWYVNALPRVTGALPFLVQLSGDDGATWITAKTVLTATFAWVFDEVRVRSFLPSATSMRVRFAVDNSSFDPAFSPEAAVDDIAVYAGSGGLLAPALAVAAAPPFSVGAPRPNPSRGVTEVELSLGRETRVRADIFDLQGRLVATAIDRRVPAGRTLLRWDGTTRAGAPAASGIYWMALRAGEDERRIRLVLIR